MDFDGFLDDSMDGSNLNKSFDDLSPNLGNDLASGNNDLLGVPDFSNGMDIANNQNLGLPNQFSDSIVSDSLVDNGLTDSLCSETMNEGLGMLENPTENVLESAVNQNDQSLYPESDEHKMKIDPNLAHQQNDGTSFGGTRWHHVCNKCNHKWWSGWRHSDPCPKCGSYDVSLIEWD